MSSSSCPHFDGCSAPLCPLDPQSLADCAFFADEEVCRRQDQACTPMVRAQKRIAKATGRDFGRGCFTAEMLAGITKITRAVKGLDPEDPITSERVKKWLSGYRGRKVPLTDAQRSELKARALKMRAMQSGRSVPEGQPGKVQETLGADAVSEVGGIG